MILLKIGWMTSLQQKERIGHQNGNTPRNNKEQNEGFRKALKDLGIEKIPVKERIVITIPINPETPFLGRYTFLYKYKNKIIIKNDAMINGTNEMKLHKILPKAPIFKFMSFISSHIIYN